MASNCCSLLVSFAIGVQDWPVAGMGVVCLEKLESSPTVQRVRALAEDTDTQHKWGCTGTQGSPMQRSTFSLG